MTMNSTQQSTQELCASGSEHAEEPGGWKCMLQEFWHAVVNNPNMLEYMLTHNAVLQWNGLTIRGRMYIIRFLVNKYRCGVLNISWFKQAEPWVLNAEESERLDRLIKTLKTEPAEQSRSVLIKRPIKPTMLTYSSSTSSGSNSTNPEEEPRGTFCAQQMADDVQMTPKYSGKLITPPNIKKLRARYFINPSDDDDDYDDDDDWEYFELSSTSADSDSAVSSVTSKQAEVAERLKSNRKERTLGEEQSLHAIGRMQRLLGNPASHPDEGEGTPLAMVTPVHLALSYRIHQATQEPRYTLIILDMNGFRSETRTARRKLLFPDEPSEVVPTPLPIEPLPQPPGAPVKRRRTTLPIVRHSPRQTAIINPYVDAPGASSFSSSSSTTSSTIVSLDGHSVEVKLPKPTKEAANGLATKTPSIRKPPRI